jgi:hypothetical protein
MSETSTRLPLVELEKTQEYQRLTPKQQLFVATYCEGGLATGTYDPIAATRTAYECKSMEVARIMSYSLMQNIRIIAVLNRHFQTEPIEAFMVTLDRAINNKKLTVAQIQALRLKCEIMGFGTRLPAQAPMAAGLKAAQVAAKEIRKSNRKPPVAKPEKLSEYGF